MKLNVNPKTGKPDTWSQQVAYNRRTALLKEHKSTLDPRTFEDAWAFSKAIMTECSDLLDKSL